MIFQFLVKAGLVVAITGFLVACGGHSVCHDCDGGFNPWETDNRRLDTSAEVEISTVVSYFSGYEYGSTQKFYHFTDEQVVLIVGVNNASSEFDVNTSVKVYAFNKNESVESINKWINNQHSDVIFGDAPEPTEMFSLPRERFSVTSSALIDHTIGSSGNEYDNYELELYIDNYVNTSSGNVEINILSFNIELDVHVITKDQNVDDIRVLDVSGIANIFSIEGYYSAYKYGSTQKFHHFTDQQAVLTIRVDNATDDFESTLGVSIDIFSKNEEIDSISRWMNNSYSDALYANTPEPISALLLPEEKFVITSVNFVDHTVEMSGSEYDNYIIEVEIDDYITLGERGEEIRISNFTAEVNVHVITKDGFALNPGASNTVTKEIVTYPTLLNAYGPTLQFYSFPDEPKVLVLRLDKSSTDIAVNLEVKRFGDDVADELIQGWINNQHAEAQMDAAEPIDTFVFPEESYTVSVSDALEHVVADLGDEYDRYIVEVSHDMLGLYQWYSVAEFTYDANVYVMTKDMD